MSDEQNPKQIENERTDADELNDEALDQVVGGGDCGTACDGPLSIQKKADDTGSAVIGKI